MRIRLLLTGALTLLICSSLIGQVSQKRFFSFTLAPGVGTNGPDPKNATNNISLNLFAGYSAANNGFELSGVSSFHSHSSSGFQFAGVVNLIGGNRKEIKDYSLGELINLSANFSGLQFAGLLNHVTGYFNGFQFSGLSNRVVLGDMGGVQFAGLVNTVGGYGEGWQLAGLANVTRKAFTGFQLATFLNRTDGDLYGAQLGFWNAAANLYGPKSEGDFGYSAQFGAVNLSSGRMDGLQIGLVNVGSTTQGVQIGLLNVNRKSGGYPIGLVNLGQGRTGLKFGYENVSGSFVQFITGSRHLANSVLIGYDAFQKNGLSLGYGLGHAHLIKSAGKFFYHPELMVRSMKVDFKNFDFSPIYSASVTVGAHFAHDFYFYGTGGIAYDPKEFFDRGTMLPLYSVGICGIY